MMQECLADLENSNLQGSDVHEHRDEDLSNLDMEGAALNFPSGSGEKTTCPLALSDVGSPNFC